MIITVKTWGLKTWFNTIKTWWILKFRKQAFKVAFRTIFSALIFSIRYGKLEKTIEIKINERSSIR